MSMSSSKLVYLARFAVVLAFCVIMLGAYTRLKDAGLGCPDWPGCYGEWVLPSKTEQLSAAQALYPDTPIETEKAWTEMAHRYLAGTLGGFILLLGGIALFKSRTYGIAKILPISLMGLLIFQALLGMWTVTLKLLPIVVMGHLLGGFFCLSLLWWLSLSLRPQSYVIPRPALPRYMVPLIITATVLLIAQIILGGWTSANYAALVCPNFPFCGQSLWPHFDWQAFNLLGANQLDKPVDFMSYSARTTIHMLHRVGALLNVVVLSLLAYKLIHIFPKHSKWLLTLLVIQIGLGITNVVKMLPLPVAVLHNGVAALLLLVLITIYHTAQQSNKRSAYDFA